jgi:acetyl-CoA carboxylase carboxyl transferase subunit alpha
MAYYLEFEKPLEDLEIKIEELRGMSDGTDPGIGRAVAELERKAATLRSEIFSNLTRWQRTLIARHPDRPYTLDYIEHMVEEFVELHGDRAYADDMAIVGGMGRIDGMPVMVIGHQKGRGVKERIRRNFGQPHPEGYRKALRLMKLAERFGIPVLTFIDTPGAYPGIGAEERGQSEAIATNLREMASLRVPIVSVVIGEGGSGGALGLGVCDRLCMLEHSTYSVISPEGCASILWPKRDGVSLGTEAFSRAADALRLAADDVQEFGICHEIVAEPQGGAHHAPQAMADIVRLTVTPMLRELAALSPDDLVDARYEHLRKLGVFEEQAVRKDPAPEGATHDAPDADKSSADSSSAGQSDARHGLGSDDLLPSPSPA